MAIQRSSITINYHETATSSITDLTGTKWQFYQGVSVGEEAMNFRLSFDCNGVSYDFITTDDNHGDYTLYYDDVAVAHGVDPNDIGWSDEAYRTIEITGGTDATNLTLIAWLQANATQIQEQSNTFSFGNLPIANMYFGTQQVKKVYLGNTLVWESAAEPTPTDMPSKGDIITLDGGIARYRVLKTNGNVAEVMALDDVANSTFNSSSDSGSVTTTFSDGSTGQKYEGSRLDNYMNSTFCNSLSANIKNAIVQKAITQSIYQFRSSEISGYDFAMTRIDSGTYWYKRKGQVSVGNRYCYALDIDDVAEYLGAGSGNTISGADLNDMFFEQTTTISKLIWLDSADSSYSDSAFCVYGKIGCVYTFPCSASLVARPAFQVDLTNLAWKKEVSVPTKGDIITLDGGTARYRVLKTNGTVAEVLALDDVANSKFNNSSVTTTFSDGSTGQKYENSVLDTYMNSTFYNSLSANIKNAIVQKAITQSIYQLGSSEISGYDFAITRITSGTKWYKRGGQVSVGNRYCYALDLDDVAEYLGAGSGNTVSGANLNDMFFEQTTAISKFVWLDSAYSDNSDNAFYVSGYSGFVGNYNYYDSYVVRPAFQVDLSKVSWVKE